MNPASRDVGPAQSRRATGKAVALGVGIGVALSAVEAFVWIRAESVRMEEIRARQTEALRGEIELRLVPAGTIVPYAGTPDADVLRRHGWLPCDGRAYRTNEFRALFAAIDNAWGTGDVGGEFRVPDLRGVFLRGVDGGAGKDPDGATRTAIAPGGNTGDSVGSFQGDAVGRHTHPVSIGITEDAVGGQIRGGPYTKGGSVTETAAHGGNETRPKNAAVHYLIKI